MEVILKISKLYKVVSLAGLALSGCRLGNPEAATPIPQGSVAGYVVSASPVAGASISVLGPSGVLAATRSDDSGYFAVPLQSLDTTIELVASGGSYGNTAGANVPSGTLRAALAYQQGSSETVAITPITNAIVAAEDYFQHQGMPAATALASADAGFTDWLGFDPLITEPVLPSGESGGGQALTAGLRYGLVLAALRHWAHANASRAQTLTGLMAADVASDGLLNGAGSGGTLMLGALALSANAYRQGLADALLQVAAAAPPGSADSLSGPNASALLAYAQTLAESTSPLFGTFAPAPFGGNTIALTVTPLPPWTHGKMTVNGSVTDPYGLPVSVTIAIDQQQYQTVTATSTFAFAIDTGTLSDAVHGVTVTAQDAAGDEASYQASVGIDNTPPQACVTVVQPLVGGALVAGQWQDISGVVAGVADGAALAITPGVWEVEVPVPVPSPLIVAMTDAAGNQQSFSWALSSASNPAPCP